MEPCSCLAISMELKNNDRAVRRHGQNPCCNHHGGRLVEPVGSVPTAEPVKRSAPLLKSAWPTSEARQQAKKTDRATVCLNVDGTVLRSVDTQSQERSTSCREVSASAVTAASKSSARLCNRQRRRTTDSNIRHCNGLCVTRL